MTFKVNQHKKSMASSEILTHLIFLYGEDQAPQLLDRAQKLLDAYRPRIQMRDGKLTEHDSILITYGDQVQSQNANPLQTLARFCKQYLAQVIGGIHILPFYPWTSDDGFSVVDYRKVDSSLGNWEDMFLPCKMIFV
ncbi:hypothetical protein [Candidatus Villigracilis proximus]|uniref:hypothetical protein n=1 Tax=Candidatus Villigracilis proximus TaxID=3140683 RepID=UPI0031EC48CC